MYSEFVNSLTQVLGEVRSGKSRYALRLAAGAARVAFLATAERREDEEMQRKIERHRAERPQHWTTIEESLNLAAAIESVKGCDLILIDCLTLFAGKLLEVYSDDSTSQATSIDALCAALKASPFPINLRHHKVRNGSRNVLLEPAMSEEEVEKALGVGYQLGEEAAGAGHIMLAIGEMGIANTTAASALTCALTGAEAKVATGRGNGIEPAAGMVLAAARHRLVVVVDGFISTAAAAIAAGLEPKVLGYLMAGHRSGEPGHQLLLDHLKLTPILCLGMRLGEGTGAVLAMPVIESAIALYNSMATFGSAGVSGAQL